MVFLRDPTEEEKQKSVIPGTTIQREVGTARRVVRIVDLDETAADTEVREMLSRRPSRSTLPSFSLMVPRESDLREWMAGVQEKILEGDLSISEVTYVLGLPDWLDGQWSDGKASQANVVYAIPSSWRYENDAFHISALVFDVADGRVTGLSLTEIKRPDRGLHDFPPFGVQHDQWSPGK